MFSNSFKQLIASLLVGGVFIAAGLAAWYLLLPAGFPVELELTLLGDVPEESLKIVGEGIANLSVTSDKPLFSVDYQKNNGITTAKTKFNIFHKKSVSIQCSIPGVCLGTVKVNLDGVAQPSVSFLLKEENPQNSPRTIATLDISRSEKLISEGDGTMADQYLEMKKYSDEAKQLLADYTAGKVPRSPSQILDKYKEAVALYEKRGLTNGDDAFAKFVKNYGASLYAARGRFHYRQREGNPSAASAAELAVDDFTKAIELYNQNDRPHLSDLYLLRGDMRKSDEIEQKRADYKKAIEVDTQNGAAYYYIWAMDNKYNKKPDADAVVKELEKNHQTGNARTGLALGSIYQEQKKPAEAEKIYKDIIDQNSSIAMAWSKLGNLQLTYANNEKKKILEAISSYSKSIDLDPMNPIYIKRREEAYKALFGLTKDKNHEKLWKADEKRRNEIQQELTNCSIAYNH